jgi:hypothetical protein
MIGFHLGKTNILVACVHNQQRFGNCPQPDCGICQSEQEIFSLVKQMEADGEEVTLLCVGEPDFLPPKAVLHRGPEIVIFLGLLIGYSLQRECQYFLYNFDTFQEFEHRPRLLYSKVTLDTRLLLEQLP